VLDNPTNSIDPLGYGALDSAINYVLTKVMTNPKVPLFIFIPATFYDVVAKGPCIIPKRLVQAGGAYVGSWAGSIAGADLGFVVGEAIVPF